MPGDDLTLVGLNNRLLGKQRGSVRQGAIRGLLLTRIVTPRVMTPPTPAAPPMERAGERRDANLEDGQRRPGWPFPDGWSRNGTRVSHGSAPEAGGTSSGYEDVASLEWGRLAE